MINFGEYTNQNKTEHNSKWPYVSDHPYRIFIVGRSGSGKTNALLNLINNQPDIDKIQKILIVFDDMIANMINNKKLNPIVTELFIRGRKLNISIVFITQLYFKVAKDVRLNSTHFLS